MTTWKRAVLSRRPYTSPRAARGLAGPSQGLTAAGRRRLPADRRTSGAAASGRSANPAELGPRLRAELVDRPGPPGEPGARGFGRCRADRHARGLTAAGGGRLVDRGAGRRTLCGRWRGDSGDFAGRSGADFRKG